MLTLSGKKSHVQKRRDASGSVFNSAFAVRHATAHATGTPVAPTDSKCCKVCPHPGCRLRACGICPIPCAPFPKNPLRASFKMGLLVVRIGAQKEACVHAFHKRSLRASVFRVTKNQHLNAANVLHFGF